MVGLTVSTAVFAAWLKTGAVTAATPGSFCERVVHSGDGGCVSSGGHVDDDLDRAVEATTEAGRQQVVGRALRGAFGGVAVIGRADAHAQRRHGDDAQGDEAGDGVAHGVLADVMRPTTGERRVRRLGHVGLAVDRQLVDLRAGQAEQPRQQRDGGDHRERRPRRATAGPSS